MSGAEFLLCRQKKRLFSVGLLPSTTSLANVPRIILWQFRGPVLGRFIMSTTRYGVFFQLAPRTPRTQGEGGRECMCGLSVYLSAVCKAVPYRRCELRRVIGRKIINHLCAVGLSV